MTKRLRHRPLAVVNHELNAWQEMLVRGHVSRRLGQNGSYIPDGNHLVWKFIDH
jgi:hypothetical protein